MSVSIPIEESIKAITRSAAPQHGREWLIRQCSPQATPAQNRVGVTVAGLPDGIETAVNLMAHFTAAAMQSMVERRATTEVFDELLLSKIADEQCALQAVFDSAQVDRIVWVRDEFDDVFEVVSQACADSACLDDDVRLIYRTIRRYVSDSMYSPTYEIPTSAPTNIVEFKLFEWPKWFRRALKTGHVVSVEKVARMRKCSNRKARLFLSAISQNDVAMAEFLDLSPTTVNEVLNGTPGPAQIAEFLGKTGFCHPSFQKRDFERPDSGRRMVAMKTDPIALEDPVRLKLKVFRDEAEPIVARADKKKSRNKNKNKRQDPED